MKFKQEGKKLYAAVNYNTTTGAGLKISIGNIFSLTESGAYFDWGLEKCGFGQFSFSYTEGKWNIMNECMGPETSSEILKAFEEAIRATGDEKAIYCLNKIISLISYQSNSLSKSILLIWNSADKEGGEVYGFEKSIKDYNKEMKREVKTEKNLVFSSNQIIAEDVKLDSISTNHYSYTNKQGTFYDTELNMFFDVSEKQHGFLSINQRTDLNTDEKKWFVSEDINEKTLGKIIKALEQSEGEYKKIWEIWKGTVKLNGGALKMAKTMLQDNNKLCRRYPVK